MKGSEAGFRTSLKIQFFSMETDITNIYTSLEALCALSQEDICVMDLSSMEIIAESPSFQHIDSYYTAAFKHWGSEDVDYLVHPEDKTNKAKFLNLLLHTEDYDIKTLSFRIRRPVGGWESIELCFKIIKRDLDSGIFLSLVRLKKKNEKPGDVKMLEQAFMQSPQGQIIWIPLYDENGSVKDFRLHQLNIKAQQLLGFDPEAVEGKHFSAIFSSEQLNAHLPIIAKRFSNKESLDSTNIVYSSSIDEQFNLSFSDAGEFLLLWISRATAQNQHLLKERRPKDQSISVIPYEYRVKEFVALRESVEQTQKKRVQELQGKVDEYKILLEATTDVVWELDNVTNDRTALIIRNNGLLPDLDLEDTLWIDAVHEDDWEQASSLWLEANLEKKKYDCKVRLKVRNGGYRWLRSTGVPMINAEGEITKWIGSLTNIHEPVMHEQELMMALDKERAEKNTLSKVNELTESFLFVLDHDLRSPINTIQMVFKLIDTSLTPEEKLDHLDLIRRTTNRLESLKAGLAEILTIRSGNHPNNPVLLAEVVQNVKHDLDQEIKKTGAQIDDRLILVPAFTYSACFAYHIVRVLLSNSLEYVQEGTFPQIEIAAYKEGEYVVLEVADSGVGIDLNRYSRYLFQPFRRCSSIGEGKGIGLYIVRTLVEYNGGFVKLESEPNKGTTVYCYFKEYSADNISGRPFTGMNLGEVDIRE